MDLVILLLKYVGENSKYDKYSNDNSHKHTHYNAQYTTRQLAGTFLKEKNYKHRNRVYTLHKEKCV